MPLLTNLKTGTNLVDGKYTVVYPTTLSGSSYNLSTLPPGNLFLLNTASNTISIVCDTFDPLNPPPFVDEVGKQWTFVLVDATNLVNFQDSVGTPTTYVYSAVPDSTLNMATSSYATVTVTQITTDTFVLQGSLLPI